MPDDLLPEYESSIKVVFGTESDVVSNFMQDNLARLDRSSDDKIAIDSIEHKKIIVKQIYCSITNKAQIAAQKQGKSSSLQDAIPSIVVIAGNNRVDLTWIEARKLAAAIWEVTDVAEFG